MLEAASNRRQDKVQRRLMLKIEKLMDSLPESIMATLPAGPEENWLGVYRKLAMLHGLLEEVEPALDADEYIAIVQKIIQLAGAVAKASSVKVDAASMFALLLIQVHLHKYSPARRQRPRRKPKTKTVPRHKGNRPQ